MHVLVLHGPNLNRLGKREPEVYGHETLASINEHLQSLGRSWGWQVSTFQSNSEGALIDQLQQAEGHYEAIIFNPGALRTTATPCAMLLLISMSPSLKSIYPMFIRENLFVIIQ